MQANPYNNFVNSLRVLASPDVEKFTLSVDTSRPNSPLFRSHSYLGSLSIQSVQFMGRYPNTFFDDATLWYHLNAMKTRLTDEIGRADSPADRMLRALAGTFQLLNRLEEKTVQQASHKTKKEQ
jgi:hypothetical protein